MSDDGKYSDKIHVNIIISNELGPKMHTSFTLGRT